eukprot:scaffold21462_cov111-Skeletonema_dohrnii-CCMP3373.AAC.1
MDTGRMFRQHYAVTVDTLQLTPHHVLDGNTATTNYTICTKDIPVGADTLSHYCDRGRGRLFITLGTPDHWMSGRHLI